MAEELPWQVRFEQELARAREARAAGNEGMARVCARRAAGLVAESYLRRQGVVFPKPNAYDQLRFLVAWPALPADVRPIVEHFLLRVTPDRELPVQADLIAECWWLRQRLLPEDSAAP